MRDRLHDRECLPLNHYQVHLRGVTDSEYDVQVEGEQGRRYEDDGAILL